MTLEEAIKLLAALQVKIAKIQESAAVLSGYNESLDPDGLLEDLGPVVEGVQALFEFALSSVSTATS